MAKWGYMGYAAAVSAGAALCLAIGEMVDTGQWPGGVWLLYLCVWMGWLAAWAPRSPLEGLFGTLTALGWLAAVAYFSCPVSFSSVIRGAATALSFGWLASSAKRRMPMGWWPWLLVSSVGLPALWLMGEIYREGAGGMWPMILLVSCPWAAAMDAAAQSGAAGLSIGPFRLWLAGSLFHMALAWLLRGAGGRRREDSEKFGGPG